MRRIGVAMLLASLFASGLAFGQGGAKRPVGPGMWGKGGWTYMTNALPGAYSLIGRLDLNAEQKKIIGDLVKSWATKRSTAYAAANAKVPHLSAAAKDPAKRAEQAKKWREAYNEAMGEPPVEKIADLLDPEQFGKILEANETLAGWAKWLAECMATYDKKLDEAVGPAADDPALKGPSMALYLLEAYQKGTMLLASRLGLTKEQLAALDELQGKSWGEYAASAGLAGPMLRTDPPMRDAFRYQNVLRAAGINNRTKKNREAVTKLLTEDQKAKITKALPLLQQRNKDVWTSYQGFAAKVDKILPPPKGKAGAAHVGGYYGMPWGGR